MMSAPRLSAAVLVLLLIGLLSVAGIAITAWMGPVLAHGSRVEHEAGVIKQLVGTDRDFVMKTDAGATLQFECRAQCRASLGHLQRHITEVAHTDVYFMREPDDTLLAIDVD